MSGSAEVRSLAQLQNLRERCATCRTSALQQIESLRAELQKLTRWLDDEATLYWQREMVLAERRWNECREALMRCQATVRADEQRPCTEERKRLERATQRRDLCEKKLRAAREARLVWQKQVIKLSGRLEKTADMADAELLATIHQLDAVISTLEAYSQIRSSEKPSPPPAS
ncbi:MAG: hypothetical protein ACTHK7_01980 [Aureliella sp.]